MKRFFNIETKDLTEKESFIEGFFDAIYPRHFFRCLEQFLKKSGSGMDDNYVHFPDFINEWDEHFHFEGVKIGWVFSGEEVIVSEEEFFKWVRLACHRYIELQPQDKEKVLALCKENNFEL